MAPRTLAPEAISDAEVQTLLDSASFRRSPTLRRLLEYLWTHRDATINEYSIAVEVLHRRPDFDPKLDSAVRVHILRLRQKLAEYYQREGAGSTIRFTIPAGSLGLAWEQVAPEPLAPLVNEVQAEPAPRTSRLWMWVALALAVVAATGWYRALRPAPATPTLPPFWQRVLDNGKPSRLVIPSPVFLQWSGRGLRVRDTGLNDFAQVQQSNELRPLIEQFGPPQLSQSYSVLASSLGAASLGQYLAVRGRTLPVVAEGQLALESFTNENLVFFGFPHTSPWLRSLLTDSNFQLESSGTAVINRQPAAGEAPRLGEVWLSATRRRLPHLVTLLPGKEKGTRILLLGGRTAAPSSFLTSPAGLATMEAIWSRRGGPAFFEAVVMAELEGDSLVRADVTAFRPVRVTD